LNTHPFPEIELLPEENTAEYDEHENPVVLGVMELYVVFDKDAVRVYEFEELPVVVTVPVTGTLA